MYRSACDEEDSIHIVDDEEDHGVQHHQQRRWGDGIVTKRLINGHLELLDNFNSESEEEEIDEENSVFFQAQDVYYEFQYDPADDAFFRKPNCRSMINQALASPHEHVRVIKFNAISIVWVIAVIILSLISWYLSSNRLSQLQNSNRTKLEGESLTRASMRV